MENQGDSSPSALIVPFGKHKGKTVGELLERDPDYARWLTAQGWLAERFAELHAAILSRGAGSDDSPEHNALQGRFLAPVFRAAFVLAATGSAEVSRCRQGWFESDRREAARVIETCRGNVSFYEDRVATYSICPDGQPAISAAGKLKVAQDKLAAAQLEFDRVPLPVFSSSVCFEARGIDVVLTWHPGHRELSVEIKPSLGEDFPSVMRQMARLRVGHLLIETYNGRALSLDQVRAMFAANHCKLVTLREVEACIAEARALLGD